MLKATLQFTSFNDLWRFKVRVHALNITVLEKLNVLIGELPEEEIQFACNTYSASLIRLKAVNE
jgi:hypothetical protein